MGTGWAMKIIGFASEPPEEQLGPAPDGAEPRPLLRQLRLDGLETLEERQEVLGGPMEIVDLRTLPGSRTQVAGGEVPDEQVPSGAQDATYLGDGRRHVLIRDVLKDVDAAGVVERSVRERKGQHRTHEELGGIAEPPLAHGHRLGREVHPCDPVSESDQRVGALPAPASDVQRIPVPFQGIGQPAVPPPHPAVGAVQRIPRVPLTGAHGGR